MEAVGSGCDVFDSVASYARRRPRGICDLHGGGGVGEAEATFVKAIAKPATTSTRSVILKPANQKTKSVNIVATPADCAAEPPLTQWLRFTVETR